MADEDITISSVWEVHKADVGKIVRDATAKLLGVGPDGICRADKRRMLKLVAGLERYTAEVFAGAAGTVGVFGGSILTDDSLWPSPAQWARDFSTWQERLAGYRAALEAAKHDSGRESCLEIFDTVTQPLLVGWYLAGAPGIVNPAVQTVPDVVTPYMLGNQLEVYRDWELERFRLLIDDVVKAAKRIAKKALKGTKLGAAIVGGALVLVGGYWIARKM